VSRIYSTDQIDQYDIINGRILRVSLAYYSTTVRSHTTSTIERFHFLEPNPHRSPSPESSPLPPLRVATARPDPTTLAPGARAAGCRDVLGRRIHLYSYRTRSRSRVCSREATSMATWSWSLSSIGRVRRARVFIFLVVLL
jgi:hypothetical protein